MARISKPGLDYFPLDVNFLQDRKVRRISCRHHAAGIAALTSLLCLIYKEKGYYVLWNKDTLFDIAQEACCEEYGVLTSQAIQEQYHKIIIDSRRKYKLPLENFWMIKEEKEANDNEEETKETKGENGEQTNESAANPGKSVAKMPQTKQETDTDIKSKQEMERENESKSETRNDKATEREGKMSPEPE